MKLDIRILPKASSTELAELLEIDRESFQSEPPRIAFEWFESFPWMYTLLKRQTESGWKTKGYGIVIPTTKFVLEGLRRGEFGEEELGRKRIRMPSEAETFYIASIGTKKDITTYESSRLVGNVTGGVLRATTPVFAIAITESGERVAREIGLEPKPYAGNVFQGVDGYTPKFLEKEAFRFVT